MTARVVALMRPVGAADRRRQVVRGWIRQHFVSFAALIAILATGFGAAPASAVVAVIAYDDAAYTYATPAQLSTTNVATTHARGSPARAGAVVWGSPVSNGRCVVAAEVAADAAEAVETGAGEATRSQRLRGWALDETGAIGKWSTSERVKQAGLPSSGSIRYVPPTNYRPGMPLPRGNASGYIDRFGNEWVKGASRTPGQAFEWDVQLSDRGRASIGWLSRDGSHVNVSLDGRVTH